MTTTIAFSNGKGGSSKSTLCHSQAVSFNDTLIIDTDDQKTCQTWFEARQQQEGLRYNKVDCVASEDPIEVRKLVRDAKQKYVFIDLAGKSTTGLIEGVRNANTVDFVIIPTRTGFSFLNRALETAEECEAAGIPYKVCIINASARKKQLAGALEVLNGWELPIFKTVLRDLTIYDDAAQYGLAPHDYHYLSKVAAARIDQEALTKEIKKAIKEAKQ